MNVASFDILQRPDIRKQNSTLWLDTYYLKCMPHTIMNMKVNTIWKSEVVRPDFVNIFLEFHFQRISELEFRIICFRSPIHESVLYGFMLQFQCSINVFDEDPRVFEMQSHQLNVYQIFCLDPSYGKLLSQNDLKTEFELKIVVKMIEYSCSLSSRYLFDTEELQKMKEEFFNKESVLKDLYYILNVPRIEDVFTGRQTSGFASMKCIYIKRIATFSKEIANYLMAKDAFIALPVSDLEPILNYILSGKKQSISDKDVLQLYFEAHKMGLTFLVDISRDCIMKKLTNVEMSPLVLEVSDRVNDKYMFDKAAETFLYWEKEFFKPGGLLEALKKSSIQCRFVVHSLGRRLKKIESNCSVGIEEDSERNFILLTMNHN